MGRIPPVVSLDFPQKEVTEPVRRDLRSILRAPTQPQFWRLYLNIARSFERPVRAAFWYTFGRGSYPLTWRVRTPSGPIDVHLYSVDDLVTLVECFGKIDYRVDGDEEVIVDVGSNIGISALYFLTHAPQSHVHLYEPVPQNVERLQHNLAAFAHRTTTAVAAVGVARGREQFTVEPTGRYGGLGVQGSTKIDVDVLDAEELVRAVLASGAPAIDVFKLDIEGLEAAVLRRLSPEVLNHIRVIYAELFDEPVALRGFRRDRQGAIVRFERVEIG